jgi:hypothetical protein
MNLLHQFIWINANAIKTINMNYLFLILFILCVAAWIWANNYIKNMPSNDFGPMGAIVFEGIKVIAIIAGLVFLIIYLRKIL